VIPAFNRQDLLQPVLEAFAGQKANVPFEVVVVDDGSEVPVSIAGLGDRFRLRRQENRGRAAAVNTGIDAARGEVVVICDSDILPTKNFVEDHWRFHRKNRAEGSTHLGGLEWGVDSGTLGEILGARANPRLINHHGPVDWTIWYTDNWSFKRSLFDRHAFRFDTAFKKWGWEELELAHRLTGAGATNQATGSATGRHLKPISIDGLLRSFTTSVPNLLYLAKQLGPRPEVQNWLGFRMATPELLVACDQVVRLAVARIEKLWPQADLGPGVRHVIRSHVSNAIFGLGIEQGFHALPRQAISGVTLPQTKDAIAAMNFGEVVGSALVLESLTGRPSDLMTRVSAIFSPFAEGRLSVAFQQRAQFQVHQCTQKLPARR
jgi:glycosyltransferase involved in cell wall biosynthesis